MISAYLVGDRQLIGKLKALPAALLAEVDKTTERLGMGVVALVKQKLSGEVFNVRTGRLRSSIQGGFKSRGESSIYYIWTNVSYAKPLFFGHKAYTIRPVSAKALHFKIGGVDVFAKSANIPAAPGKNVLAMALQQYKPTIIREYQLSLQRTAERVLHS